MFFLITKNNALLESVVGPDYRFGDLYSLAKVRAFRPAVPLIFGPDRGRDSIDRGEPLARSEIYFFGDSFGFVDFGESTFWLQLSRNMGRPIFSIYNHTHNDFWENPYRFLDTISDQPRSTSQPRIVIYEIAERLIDSQFSAPLPITKPSDRSHPPSGVFLGLTNLYQSMFSHTEERHELLFKHSPVTSPLLVIWNTAMFKILGRISPETPVYSLDPPFLFFRDSVETFRTRHDEAAISHVADNIASFDRHLRERYQCTLRLVLVPNKISIYHELVTTEPYDDFLPRLRAELQKRGVRSLEFVSHFRQETNLLYWPTDTHWNCDGIRAGVEETLKAWPELAR